MTQPSSTTVTVGTTTPTTASMTEGATTAASIVAVGATSATQAGVCAYPFYSWECVTDTWASPETWEVFDGSGVVMTTA